MAKINFPIGGGSGGGLTEAEVKALIRASKNTDLPFAGLTGLSLVGSAALTGNNQIKIVNAENLVQIRLARTDYQRLKSSLAFGNLFTLRQSSDKYFSTFITRFEEFNEIAASDTLDISLSGIADFLDSDTGTVDIEIEDADAEQWNDYVDGRAQDVLERDFASLILTGGDSLSYTTTTDPNIPSGSFRIAADRTITIRAKDAAMAAKLRKQLINGKDISFHKNSSEAAAQIDSAVTEKAGVSPAQFSFSVTAHAALGSDFSSGATGFTLEVVSPIVSAVFDNVPHGTIPVAALAEAVTSMQKSLSAEGGNAIGSLFGTISDSTFASLAANNSQLLPVPHPNQNSTPAGTGEVTFSNIPSAFKKCLCMLDIGFGWASDDGDRVIVHTVLLKKEGSGAWAIANKKKNVIYYEESTTHDRDDIRFNVFASAPVTAGTDTKFKWCVVRGNNETLYPLAQDVAFLLTA